MRDGRSELVRYWDVAYPPSRALEVPASEAECVHDIAAMLEEAIEIRTRADVPIACYLSGGVDSSLAAARLQAEGRDVVGVTLHLWDAEGSNKVGRCCAPEDRDDARRTCEHLGIPHYVIDEREAFRAHVVDPFITAKRAGRTPLPCAVCNHTVKLARLADLA